MVILTIPLQFISSRGLNRGILFFLDNRSHIAQHIGPAQLTRLTVDEPVAGILVGHQRHLQLSAEQPFAASWRPWSIILGMAFAARTSVPETDPGKARSAG